MAREVKEKLREKTTWLRLKKNKNKSGKEGEALEGKTEGRNWGKCRVGKGEGKQIKEGKVRSTFI